MALVTRWKTPGGPTSAAAVCGSAWASDTTTPSRASLMALATFSGVMRFVVPLDSCPNGAHLPQVLNSVRHCSYWARSAAVSGGATGAGACVAGAGCACACVSPPATRPAMTRPALTVTDDRLFRMRSSPAFKELLDRDADVGRPRPRMIHPRAISTIPCAAARVRPPLLPLRPAHGNWLN